MQVVETERHLFLGKQIVTLSPDAHIKLSTAMHAKFHHFTPLPSHLLLLPFSARYTTPTPHSMASEIGQNLPITDEPVAGDNKSALGGGGVMFWQCILPQTWLLQKIADKNIPAMSDY
jgi:hypothetical protein